MYSHLGDDEDPQRRPDVGHGARPAPPVTLASRLRGPGPYRLATICLAALCAILLISVIAVAVHSKDKPQGGAEETHAQKQDVNASTLVATVRKLEQEKVQLQKEKDELLAKLAATKGPEVARRTEATPAPIVCPPGWRLFGHSCYLISTVSGDWEESQSACQSKGAHLAIILTAAEQTFLWNLLPRGHWNSFWFGITDAHTEDQWKWVDGSPLVGGFWEVGEPNNHIDEDCGYIVKTNVLERVAIRSWYDAPCSMNLPYICEKEMAAAG